MTYKSFFCDSHYQITIETCSQSNDADSQLNEEIHGIILCIQWMLVGCWLDVDWMLDVDCNMDVDCKTRICLHSNARMFKGYLNYSVHFINQTTTWNLL